MKNLLLFLLLTFSLTAFTQHTKVKWKDVELREFTQRFSEKDSTTIGKAVAEWFEPAEAGSLSELSPKELMSIKKKAAKKGCNLVYVDVRGVYQKRKGELYVLAIRQVVRHGAIVD